MRVINSQDMQEIEAKCVESYGFSASLIIENLGPRGADWISDELLQDKSYGEIMVLVGAGNNGADGLSIARQLVNRGHRVRAFVLFPEELKSAELKQQILMAENFGVKVDPAKKIEQLSSYFAQTQNEFLVIDAIFGTGVRLPVSDYLFDIFNLVNQYASVMVSIDMPSGICSNTGRKEGSAIYADYTLAIGLPKVGHYMEAGLQHTGDLLVLDAGFPTEILQGGSTSVLTVDSFKDLFSKRNKFAHKNSFGHTLVVAGSFGLTGAAAMAAEAALKVGTGLVTAVTWQENYQELQAAVINEVMTGVIPISELDKQAEISRFNRYDCIVVGPGLGRSAGARDVVLGILQNFAGPIVIDADALNCLSLQEDRTLLSERKAPTILTPHIGEFARFIDVPKEKLLKNPLGYLKELVESLNSTIVMKGSCTYLGFPDGQIYINHFPNDGMASGGTGDVLAGMIGGLLAQTTPQLKEHGIFRENSRFYAAVRCAVYAHTLAGKYAVDSNGARAMTAKSIIENFAAAFLEIENETQE